MAVELAVAFVSIVPETKRVKPGVKKAFQDADGEAAAAGKRHGEKYSGGFTSALKNGSKGIAAGFILANAAVTGLIKHVGTIATVVGFAAKIVRGFSVSLLAGATALRALSGAGLAKLAGLLRIVAAFASRVAREISRITSALLVMAAVAKLVGFMTNFARTLGKVTVGAALALGVVSGLGTMLGGFLVSAATAAAAALAGLGGAAAGILGPAIAVTKIAFKGLSDAAKEFNKQFEDSDALLNKIVGERMAPLLTAFHDLRTAIVDQFSASLQPAFGKMGGLLSDLTPQLAGLSGVMGNIGKDIADSLAGPETKAAFQQIIGASGNFFKQLTGGESGLGGLTSGVVQFISTATQAFNGSGSAVNEFLLNLGEKLRDIKPEQLIHAFDSIRQTLTNLGQIAGPIFNLFRELGTISAKGMAPGFVAIGQAIRDATPGLAKMAEVLMPALGQVMVNLAPIIPALVQAFTPWAQIMAVLAPHIATMVTVLAPFAPVLLGVALAVKVISIGMIAWNAAMFAASVAQGVFAAATGAGTAALAGNTIALGAYRVATIASTVATWALNGAMAVLTSPITLIIAAIVAIVAALVLLYKKNEAFRNFVNAAWEKIKIGIQVAWAAIKVAFDAIIVAVQWIGDKMVWLWQNVMQPAWTVIKALIQAWWAAAQVVFNAFVSVLKFLGDAVMVLWHNVIEPAFQGIKFVIEVWWAAAQIVFQLFKIAIGAVGDVISWLWHNVAEPAFNGIGAVLSAVWDSVIKPIWDQFTAALHIVGDAAMWLWNEAIVPAWNGIKTAISAVWDFLQPVFDKIGGAFNVLGDIATKVGGAMKSAFDGVVDVLKKPLHVLGGLLASVPSSILGVDIPGVSSIHNWGETLQGLRYGGMINAAPGGFIVNARASQKHRGLLNALGGQRITGPGSGTSDSIAAMSGGRPIARVSTGETYFTPGLANALGGLLGGINGGLTGGFGLASGGAIGSYGLATGTNIAYGGSGFPDWVIQLAQEYGLKPSTYPGHQESDRNEAGYAPNPQHQNRGIDWSGSVEAMQKFAEHLLAIAPNTPSLEQIIWKNPSTGQRIGWAGGKADTDGSYFAQDYSGHTDHVHTRQSATIVTAASDSQTKAATPEQKAAVDNSPSSVTSSSPSTSDKTSTPAEAFSASKTTRDLLGNLGKIAGESLFDIFDPGFQNEPDVVSLADRYTIKRSDSGASAATSGTSTAEADAQQPATPVQPPALDDKDYVGQIAKAAKDKGLGIGAAIIATGTALVESNLKMYANSNVPESLNYPHDAVGSDHDSLNYMQQRPSQGWGTVAQLMNSFYPATAFMDALVKVPGWETMDKGAAAQAVQRSAYPGRYAAKMAEAEQLLKGKFDRGGMIPPGLSLMDNQTKRYEPAVAFNQDQWSTLNEIAGGSSSVDARMIIEKLVVQDWREARKELKSMGTRHSMRYGGRPS